jgi:excisionase family DNA binding protein
MADLVEPTRGLTRSELTTAREVAGLLGVPVSTVLHWGRIGVLPRVRFGRHVRFVRGHVEAAILTAESPVRHGDADGNGGG